MKHIQKAALVLASAGFAKAFVAPRINTATFCSAMSASSFYVSGYMACNPCLVPSLLDFSTNNHMCHSSSYVPWPINSSFLCCRISPESRVTDPPWMRPRLRARWCTPPMLPLDEARPRGNTRGSKSLASSATTLSFLPSRPKSSGGRSSEVTRRSPPSPPRRTSPKTASL